MATLYFTNNAYSGEGSLLNVLANASEGDVIEPSDGMSGDVHILPTAPYEPNVEGVTIRGNNGRRIILDGSGVRQILKPSANCTFIDVDFVDGYSAGTGGTGGGALFMNSNCSVSFVRCRFLGGSTQYYGGNVFIKQGGASFESCVIAGGSGYYQGGVRVNSTAGACGFTNCTIIGNANNGGTGNTGSQYADLFVQSGIATDPTVTNCIIGGETTLASTVGFVAAPPDAYKSANWSATDWQGFDLRLEPGSSYLTGGASTGNDVAGRTRRGAIGAYEGAWFVVAASGSKTLSSDVETEYADIGAGATVVFSGTDRKLTVTEEATVGAATFEASTGSTGYLATPAGTDLTDATLTGVKAVEYGAGLTSFSATLTETTVSFAIAKTNSTSPVLLEKKNGSTWQTVSTDADNSTTDTGVTSRTTYRVFDGETFLEATVFAGTTLTVANGETVTLTEDLTVEYANIATGATIVFSGTDRKLTVTEEATVGAATFQASTGSTGYFATPTGTDVTDATLTGVKACEYGAELTSFEAVRVDSDAIFTIGKTGSAAVLLEKKDGSTWQTVSTNADNSTTDSGLTRTTLYRVFDGDTFLESAASEYAPKVFWTIRCWAEAKSNGGGSQGLDGESFNVKSWALDPELE